ncbi:hypothetical protein VNO78_29863 [Psophocarpus tetragonolobus]|uniref:Uncharacterized protein n=1 Tax=Psophocarpus tetragonolobus TaxID=3891 RepID=A0AAN9RWR2_PSOTE
MLSLEPFTEDRGRSAVHPRGNPTNQLPCALRVYSPVDSHTCQTPWSVFQDGPNGEPTGRRQEHARAEARPRAHAAIHNRHDDVSASISTARAWATVAIRIGPCPESIGGPALALFAIGLSPVFSLGRNLPPDWGCIPKQPDSPTAPRGATGSGHNGALTLSGAPFQGTWARSATEDASPDYNSNARGDRFSWWALPGSLAVTKGILACPQPNGFGRNLRSKTRWFTGFCNSHQVSHFATFFIDARAEISVAESHFASCVVTTPAGHRLRVPKNRPLQFQFPWHTKRRGLCFIERERGWAVQTMTNPLPTEGEHDARVVPS